MTNLAKISWALPPLDLPVGVMITFYMPRPASDKKRVWAYTKPDVDKLVRSTLDSLTEAGVLIDDSRVVSLLVEDVCTAGDTGADVDVFDYSSVVPRRVRLRSDTTKGLFDL